jgi:DeoR/GlpR family transcriptional regulator of sugar metabolism
MSQKLYRSDTWLRLRFIIQRKSIAEMAKEARVTEMTIRRALQSAGMI